MEEGAADGIMAEAVMGVMGVMAEDMEAAEDMEVEAAEDMEAEVEEDMAVAIKIEPQSPARNRYTIMIATYTNVRRFFTTNARVVLQRLPNAAPPKEKKKAPAPVQVASLLASKPSPAVKPTDRCSRCGREGHPPKYCLAKYDIGGYEIEDLYAEDGTLTGIRVSTVIFPPADPNKG